MLHFAPLPRVSRSTRQRLPSTTGHTPELGHCPRWSLATSHFNAGMAVWPPSTKACPSPLTNHHHSFHDFGRLRCGLDLFVERNKQNAQPSAPQRHQVWPLQRDKANSVYKQLTLLCPPMLERRVSSSTMGCNAIRTIHIRTVAIFTPNLDCH
jgi:hypothetical protein